MIKIYTDGAVSNNGTEKAIGSWAFIIVQDEHILFEDSKKVLGATNQQMELIAAIKACDYIKNNYINKNIEDIYEIISDSAYLINCYEQDWWSKWQYNGWKNAAKKPVANKELWEELIPYFKNQNIIFKKIKGHNGDSFNEKVDKLAVKTRLKEN